MAAPMDVKFLTGVVFLLIVSCGDTEGDHGSTPRDAGETGSGVDARAPATVGDSAMKVTEEAGEEDTFAPPEASASSDDAAETGPALVPVPIVDNVVLWLDAAKGVDAVDGQVAKWTDQSSFHNDALQNTAGMRPALVQAGGSGHPVIRFEASRKTVLLVSDAASLHFGTDDLTIEVVVGYHNKSKGGMPVDHLDGWGYVFNKMVGNRLGVGLMGNWPVSETSPIGTQFGCETTEQGGSLLSKAMGYNDDKPRLWGMRRTGSTVELRRNGNVDNSGKWNPPVNVDAMGTPPVSIGARLYQGQASASFPLDGDISEIVAVKGTTSSDQLKALEGYLIDKYTLAP
jgi:hypothetical protein